MTSRNISATFSVVDSLLAAGRGFSETAVRDKVMMHRRLRVASKAIAEERL
jgi:hypothetical protein